MNKQAGESTYLLLCFFIIILFLIFLFIFYLFEPQHIITVNKLYAHYKILELHIKNNNNNNIIIKTF